MPNFDTWDDIDEYWWYSPSYPIISKVGLGWPRHLLEISISHGISLSRSQNATKCHYPIASETSAMLEVSDFRPTWNNMKQTLKHIKTIEISESILVVSEISIGVFLEWRNWEQCPVAAIWFNMSHSNRERCSERPVVEVRAWRIGTCKIGKPRQELMLNETKVQILKQNSPQS